MNAHPGDDFEIVARPFPGGQTILLAAALVDEIMFGGARGSAKSQGLLLEWLKHQEQYQEKAKGLMFRRKYTDIQDLIGRAQTLFAPFGAKWTNSSDKTTTFVFPNGATLRFSHMNSDGDWVNFKGQEYTRIYVDEADEFPSWEPIGYLYACLRSPDGVPCGLRLSSNPYGAGNAWIKERYIDPMPSYHILNDEVPDPEIGEPTIKTRMFIPGKLSENPKLNTAEYRANLRLSAPNEDVYRAWLNGDYNVQGGAFFHEFRRDKHVIAPFKVPADWPRYCAFDVGSGHPGAVVYFALVPEDTFPEPKIIGGTTFAHDHRYKGGLPKGALVQYREIYFAQKASNTPGARWVGQRLPIEEMAKQIVEAERTQVVRGVTYKEQLDPETGMVTHKRRVAGHDLFAEKNGPSLSERMRPFGLHFQPAEITRVATRTRMSGWNMIRHRLNGQDGEPMIYFMDHCIHTIRTLPALQIDPDRPEDVLKKSDDDLGDAVRYACMCRPFIPRPDLSEDHWPAYGVDSTTIVVPAPKPPGYDPYFGDNIKRNSWRYERIK